MLIKSMAKPKFLISLPLNSEKEPANKARLGPHKVGRLQQEHEQCGPAQLKLNRTIQCRSFRSSKLLAQHEKSKSPSWQIRKLKAGNR
jgi:hypothetical protein